MQVPERRETVVFAGNAEDTELGEIVVSNCHMYSLLLAPERKQRQLSASQQVAGSAPALVAYRGARPWAMFRDRSALADNVT
jgi:hypothetical protein